MTWQAWKLTYQALSPTLVGGLRFGFIQRTRYYVPGWTLWGAITAALTRAFYTQADAKKYQCVGSFVEQDLLTSYAGILLDGEPALPHWGDEGRLKMGTLGLPQFEARFIRSSGQVGLEPATQTAAQGQLHETEVIVDFDPQTRTRVQWQFTLYLRDGALAAMNWTEDEVRQAIRQLSVGGDRTYGLGSWLASDPPAREPVSGDAWPIPLDWNPEEKIMRAHVPVEELQGIEVYGRAETISRLVWQNAETGPWGPGQRIETGTYYLPGCYLKEGDWQPIIGPKGIWLRASNDAQTST